MITFYYYYQSYRFKASEKEVFSMNSYSMDSFKGLRVLIASIIAILTIIFKDWGRRIAKVTYYYAYRSKEKAYLVFEGLLFNLL